MPILLPENLVTGSPLLLTFVFAFGAVIGSFLNAVLWRMRTGESVADGRSYCPHCHHQLAAADLVPLLSFLLLRGRCRYCRKGIHPSYFLVELSVGLLFVLMAAVTLTGQTVAVTDLARLLLRWYAVAVLAVSFVYDLRYMLLPRRTLLVGAVIAGAANLALGMSPITLAAGVAVGAGVFWVQRAVSRGRWVGGGDVVLGAFMGALLGAPQVAVALFLAYVSGAVVGLSLMALRRAAWGGEIAFGTFLSAATAVTLAWGERLLSWYLGLAL